MKNLDRTIDYWFYLEIYTYVSINEKVILLYNTLDGSHIEVKNLLIIDLVKNIYNPINGGVILLSGNMLQNNVIYLFITKVLSFYMGDVIEVSLSFSKPTQILPLLNLLSNFKKSGNIDDNIIENKVMMYVSDISLIIDSKIFDANFFNLLLNFSMLIPSTIKFNLLLNDFINNNNIVELITFTEKIHFTNKNIFIRYSSVCSNVIMGYEMKYNVLIDFPLKRKFFKHALYILNDKKIDFKMIFLIASISDYKEAIELVKQFDIEKYEIKPIFNKSNIDFFKQNIYMSRSDIFNDVISIREIFAHQVLNTNDFGKLTIKTNGNVYANIHFHPLGNIKTHNIQEIIYTELNEGNSWLRIRSQAPCNNCIYQWLCPSPSDYEIAIGKPNLCHIHS